MNQLKFIIILVKNISLRAFIPSVIVKVGKHQNRINISVLIRIVGLPVIALLYAVIVVVLSEFVDAVISKAVAVCVNLPLLNDMEACVYIVSICVVCFNIGCIVFVLVFIVKVGNVSCIIIVLVFIVKVGNVGCIVFVLVFIVKVGNIGCIVFVLVFIVKVGNADCFCIVLFVLDKFVAVFIIRRIFRLAVG